MLCCEKRHVGLKHIAHVSRESYDSHESHPIIEAPMKASFEELTHIISEKERLIEK